ncbi:hypothetical protein V6N11_059983 [Hibiscus sabdariffa]|uniref:Uncharacterized protein n=2 Tax=Hibiscus sabdariffa TaxID=183260 RepID=A0ABR2NYQ2_9ROSI
MAKETAYQGEAFFDHEKVRICQAGQLLVQGFQRRDQIRCSKAMASDKENKKVDGFRSSNWVKVELGLRLCSHREGRGLRDLWPSLAQDTSPNALLSTLQNKIEDGRNVYIATN